MSAALFALVGLGALASGRRTAAPAPAAAEITVTAPRSLVGRENGAAPPPKPVPTPIADPADPLAEVSIFAQLDAGRRRAVAAAADAAVVAGGDWLFRQGDPPDGLYVVQSGRLHVLREQQDAEPELLHEVARGDVIGALALLSGAPRTASVRARRDSELLRISPAAFDELLTAEPELGRALIASVGALLERARGIEQPPPAAPGAVAVVAGGPDAPTCEVFEALTAAMPSAGRLVRADVDGHGDRIAAFGGAIDRAERAHGRVVMLAAEPPGDAWTNACIRTTDRVVLVVGSVAPDVHAVPRGADVVLCGPPLSVADIEPRSVHRALPGDMAALARRLTADPSGWCSRAAARGRSPTSACSRRSRRRMWWSTAWRARASAR